MSAALAGPGVTGARHRRNAFLVMAAVTWLSVGAVVAAIWRVDHTFTYPLDDPYIHLALARNLLDHGTFGVVPGLAPMP